jgi:hypothetical protein
LALEYLETKRFRCIATKPFLFCKLGPLSIFDKKDRKQVTFLQKHLLLR